jgi:hypothetical protein
VDPGYVIRETFWSICAGPECTLAFDSKVRRIRLVLGATSPHAMSPYVVMLGDRVTHLDGCNPLGRDGGLWNLLSGSGGRERETETDLGGDTHPHTHTHTHRERERERERENHCCATNMPFAGILRL